jgi:hypothetical protein
MVLHSTLEERRKSAGLKDCTFSPAINPDKCASLCFRVLLLRCSCVLELQPRSSCHAVGPSFWAVWVKGGSVQVGSALVASPSSNTAVPLPPPSPLAVCAGRWALGAVCGMCRPSRGAKSETKDDDKRPKTARARLYDPESVRRRHAPESK